MDIIGKKEIISLLSLLISSTYGLDEKEKIKEGNEKEMEMKKRCRVLLQHLHIGILSFNDS